MIIGEQTPLGDGAYASCDNKFGVKLLSDAGDEVYVTREIAPKLIEYLIEVYGRDILRQPSDAEKLLKLTKAVERFRDLDESTDTDMHRLPDKIDAKYRMYALIEKDEK